MCDKEADLAEHAAHRRPSRLRGRAVAVQHTGLGTENRLSEPFSVPLVCFICFALMLDRYGMKPHGQSVRTTRAILGTQTLRGILSVRVTMITIP